MFLFDDMFGLLGLIAFVALIVMVIRLNARIGLLERETGALRSFVLSLPASAAPAATADAATGAPPATSVPSVPASPVEAPPSLMPAEADLVPPAGTVAAEDGLDLPAPPQPPAGPQSDMPDAAPPPAAPAPAPARPDLETALGTRWAVWVGGLALALGGIFLVRYSIEAGWFGPAARITLAGLFGLALIAAGEAIRRSGYRLPVQDAAAAYIPAILTAAGAFTLFAAIYTAHGVYGLIGPLSAFVLLGIVGLTTMILALIHGQALAGLGLLGSLLTPLLVSSESPNAWALFGYLAIVLVSSVAVARTRLWRFLATAALAGTGAWCVVYLAAAASTDLAVTLFINGVMLAALAVLWCGRRDVSGQRVFPAAAPAFFVGLVAFALLVDDMLRAAGGTAGGTALLVAMLAAAAWRREAIALVFGAGIAATLAAVRFAFIGNIGIDISGGSLEVEGFSAPSLPASIAWGVALAAAFLGGGLWQARRLVSARGFDAAVWSAFAALVPLAMVVSLWISQGNPNIDIAYALGALALAIVLTAGAEWVARAETPPLAGGAAVSFALAGAAVAVAVAIHSGFGPGWTTVLLGAAAVVPALATRVRSYPVLGWLSVGAAVAVLVRAAIDPTIVGADMLGTTPVANWLLPGYGIPAVAFAFAAWQLARTTDGRPRLVMEAAAAVFAMLTLAMLVRHAMNGGSIDDAIPTLAEQAVYSLIALGFGAILISLDLRSPSPVLRWGSIGIGVLSVAIIVIQHFGLLNPVFTNESTGSIPVFNLLFLAYLLPALSAAALAWYARGKRPAWYSAMLALLAAALAFTYATLSVRRLFKGQYIGWWSGLDQLETYAYSALWLGLGVVLLVVGVRSGSFVVRAASGALIAVAVAKVFLFDMSELEGVLRALSFIGLGVVLIGIGLFYQRLLRRAAA